MNTVMIVALDAFEKVWNAVKQIDYIQQGSPLLTEISQSSIGIMVIVPIINSGM